MRKFKILGIAPYSGLKDMMINISNEWNNMEFVVYEGDLENGADIVANLGAEHFDAIISRGGTAREIRKITNTFVYGIAVSYYDVLSSIKLAENFNGKFAIVGFSDIADTAKMLRDILQYDIRIEAVTSEKNAYEMIDKLKEEGYSLVVGDVVSTRYASSIGLTSMLITSGVESIRTAFDEVIHICRYFSEYRIANKFYQMNQTMHNEQLLVYDSHMQLVFCSGGSDRAAVETYAKKMFRMRNSTPMQKEIHEINGKTFLMTLESYALSSEIYYLFNVMQMTNDQFQTSSCIKLRNKGDVSGNFFSLFYNNTAHKELRETAEKYSVSDFPVMIIGESGTGKDKMAELLYAHSHYCNFPYYTIDCDIATDEEIKDLILNSTSPLFDENTTFYFRHITSLSQEQLKMLLLFAEKHNFHKRNRFLCSLVEDEQNSKLTERELKYTLDCLSVTLPPLRQRMEDIPSISNLYINEFNIKHGNQISGIEPEAVSLLQGFHWPQNLRQLKYVLAEACVQTTATYISRETILHILNKERLNTTSFSVSGSPIDLSQTLDNITYQVVCAVLVSENMNKTRTAKRLGISRTTLWRILEQHNS